MSRSNPNVNTPNPATRWFEWRGKDGLFEYYDKVKKEAVVVKLPFVFIVLDRTSTIRGYNKKMKSGLFSNEVRDVSRDSLTVKFFTGGIVAQGLWADIKDKVVGRSGKFACNLYVAFKDGGKLQLGAIQLKGCALGPWFEFEKKHGKSVYEKAVAVKGFTEDTTGDVAFKAPVYSLCDISEETNKAALELDKELQAFLSEYFKRSSSPSTERAAANDEPFGAPDDDGPPQNEEPDLPPPADDDNVPF